MSIIASHSSAVTLWLVPPFISVKVAVNIIPFGLSDWFASSASFSALMNTYDSSIAFFASQGALACALFPTFTLRLIAILPLYAIVMFFIPLGSPKIA